MSEHAMYRHCVYALSGPDMDVRYVGRTRCGLESRLVNHLHSAKYGKKPFHLWLREQGANLVMREIERFYDVNYDWCKEASDAERKWVIHYAQAGNDLFNIMLMPKPGPAPRIISLEEQGAELICNTPALHVEVL